MTEGVPEPQPLAGLRVLDLTHALAGPYCTMVLGDLGADVIKLEPPGHGDHARQWGPPFINGESSYFMSVNRNKRSVTLDLKSEGGLKAAMELAVVSDVLVENFRPGTAARLGLGWDVLHERNAGLVYASISGYGQGRPRLTGYDQIAQGTSGLMSITGEPGGGPVKVGVPVGDIVAGMFAAHAIMAALLERARTNTGRYIDVALNDSLLALLTHHAGRYFATGEPPTREGNFHSTIAPYGSYATRDGHINLAVGSDDQYRRLCEALQAPELASDARFATNADRQTARHELAIELERRLTRRSTGEWLARMEAAGVPAGPILDLAAAFTDPVAVERGMRVDVDHPVAGRVGQVGPPWRLDGYALPIRQAPPTLGQHTAEVLSQVLGYSPEQVAAAQPQPVPTGRGLGTQ